MLATTSPPFSEVAWMAGALRVITLIWQVEPPQTSVLVGNLTCTLAATEVSLGSVIEIVYPFVEEEVASILPAALDVEVNFTA